MIKNLSSMCCTENKIFFFKKSKVSDGAVKLCGSLRTAEKQEHTLHQTKQMDEQIDGSTMLQ